MKIEDVTLDQVYEFMERGSISKAPKEISDYLDLLEKVRGMINRVDIYGSRDAVVKHLTIVDKLSKYKALKIYNETIEYFHVDQEVSKDAWRNFYADKMDKVANFAMLTMKDVADAAKVHKMLYDTMIARDVNTKDDKELPENFFDSPINLMSLDANIFEFGTANREQLKSFINSLPEITEKEKNRIEQETLILPLKIFPDEQENARKS